MSIDDIKKLESQALTRPEKALNRRDVSRLEDAVRADPGAAEAEKDYLGLMLLRDTFTPEARTDLESFLGLAPSPLHSKAVVTSGDSPNRGRYDEEIYLGLDGTQALSGPSAPPPRFGDRPDAVTLLKWANRFLPRGAVTTETVGG